MSKTGGNRAHTSKCRSTITIIKPRDWRCCQGKSVAEEGSESVTESEINLGCTSERYIKSPMPGICGEGLIGGG